MEKDKKPENPNAFPLGLTDDHNSAHDGMTLRDYFAAKAMQASDLEQYANTFGINWAEKVSEDSFKLADAMLKQREI
jgi:hypothetical protein